MTQQDPPPGMPAPTGYGEPAAPPRRTNTMAVLALVFAFVFSPLGIVFGILGRSQIRRSGERGRGLATAGLVLGIVFTALGVLAAVLVGVLLSRAVNTVSTEQAQAEIVRTTQSIAGVAPADVHCPTDIPVKAGTTFSCTAQLDGQPVRYTVREQDDKGNVHIDSDGFVVVAALVNTLQQQIGQQVGGPVTVTCDTGGRKILLAGPGTQISCTAAAADNPANTIRIAATVTDQQGNISFHSVG